MRTEQKVERAVLKVFSAPPEWIKLKARYVEVVQVRYALFYTLKRGYNMTYRQISTDYGIPFGTIRSAVEAAEGLIDTNIMFKKKIDQIKEICFRK